MTHTYILYRILGNDLPPRHGERQTLENLRFILENEDAFPDCEKRWVVNRIADKERESELLALLAAHGQPYVHIPFDIADFAACFLDGENLPDDFNLIDVLAGRLPPNGGGHALEWMYRRKNIYAINVNGARNAAIADGVAAGATWIMPWDGACFLTASGYAGIVGATAKRDVRYVIVPMTRTPDNRVLLKPGYAPAQALDEPQMVFHREARDLFDEALRYGHRPKAELLRRIGVPGPWQTWNASAWEPKGFTRAHDAGRFAAGGWVGRLDAHASKSVEAGDSQRWIARFQGLTAHCQTLERQVVSRAIDSGIGLSCYGALVRSRPSPAAVAKIVEAADGFLAVAPPSVIDKTALINGASANDYVSIGRYFHALPGGGYTLRDGDTNPAAIRGRPESDAYDRYRLQTMIDGVTMLAVANFLTGSAHYGQKAVAFVDRWFIAPDTRMNPHGRFAQIRPDQLSSFNAIGTLDFRDFWPLLDALSLLRRQGFIDDARDGELRHWFRAFHDHLNKRASSAAARMTNIGTLHDVLAASVAAYLNDVNVLTPILERASVRISSQIRAWGWQPAETLRAMPLHYSLFAIQALISIASIGRACGVDVWRYAGADHRSIPMAIRFVAGNRRMFADYGDRAVQFDDRITLAARQVPEDAADFAAVADLREGRLVNADELGTDEGLPPLWAYLYGDAGEVISKRFVAA